MAQNADAFCRQHCAQSPEMVKIIGDAAYMRLTRRALHDPWRHALVDLDDYDRLLKSKWRAVRIGKSFYAEATSIRFLAAHHRKLHHYVLRSEPGKLIDHISGDTLDNRKQNLRFCTPADNSKNKRRPTFPGKTSRFKGVCWSKYDGAWLSRIASNGVVHELGLFDVEEDAARAYDLAAPRVHGEFARTNEVMRLYEQEDPFVPDCSKAEDFDRREHLPGSREQRLSPRNYTRRLDDRIKTEIEVASKR
jgi:hypothetical protein